MKKNVVIVFGITKDYAFALANVLIGMKKHCNKFWDDVIVYHDGLSDEDMEKVSMICECKFVLYDTNNISKESNQESVKAYSYMALARFECFDMLQEYQYVIWHDVDILIQKNFEELLRSADKSGFALTCNPQFYGEQNFYKLVTEYDLLRPLYNSGLMVLKDTLLNYSQMKEYCYSKFNKYADRVRYLDQAILNIMIQDFKIQVGNISLSQYCCHPSDSNFSNASIIHAYGKDKFWNSMELKIQFPEWVSNNEEWERICTGVVSKKIEPFEKMPKNPKVSIIMSIFDRIDYVDEAIESILNQTFTSFEFLIILEKTDNQDKIRETLEKQYVDKRIRIICNEERLGFAASLNVGLEQARGEFIARMDDDDISLPERLEKEVEFLDNNKDISVIGSYIKMFMNCNNICTVPATHEELVVRSLTETPIYHPTVMFRTEDFIRNNLKYDTEYMTEDYDLWCRALKKVKFANIQEVLLLYRASGQNATATQGERVLNSHVEIVKRNFREYLDIELSYDEVILLERPEILTYCFNLNELSLMRENTLDKIFKANKQLKVFDNKLLEARFVTYKPGLTMRLTKFLQKWPTMLKIAKICYGMISQNGEYSYLFHKNLREKSI